MVRSENEPSTPCSEVAPKRIHSSPKPVSIPLVIRTPAGGRRGYGPTHSQNPENIFAAIPGLTVLCGSQRHDNGALLRSAVRHWPFPTLFLEHKLVYGATEDAGEYRPVPAHPDDIGGGAFPTLRLGNGQADAATRTLLSKYFGSFDAWESEFRRVGNALAGGTGWVVLAWNPALKLLENSWLLDHTNGITGSTPILVMDLYEHAFHMDYGSAAAKYIDAFMANVNWETVAARLKTVAA